MSSPKQERQATCGPLWDRTVEILLKPFPELRGREDHPDWQAVEVRSCPVLPALFALMAFKVEWRGD